MKLGKGQGVRFRLDSTVQIAMVGDEAVFAMSGAQLRLKARGHWPGHSSCSYQTLASFLKIPPPLGDVIIRYANDRLIISTLQVTARWVAKSATPVADEDVPAPYPYSRACLSRGRKTTGLRADQRRLERVSESRGNNPIANTINELNRFSALPRITALACSKCEYRWMEFQQAKQVPKDQSI